jgi:TQXA domain-containing protein/LPXTG-motif cell wall-anchored protein
VEIDTRIDTQHGMVEKSWDSYPNPKSPFHSNRAKINWILHFGYPVVGTDALAKTLTDQGVKVTNGISDKEAISATQAAIWHFSDGRALDEANPLPKGPMDSAADVVALYKYLTGAGNVGIGEQPTPALAISPADATGVAGDKIGPFTVSTTGQVTKLTTKLSAGVKVVDESGNEVTSGQVKDGSKLFLDVPADAKEGNGSFELTATAGVDTGRLFVGENYAKEPTQSLIVAKAEKSEIVASAGGKWTEKEVSPTSSEAPPTTTTTTETSPVPTTPSSTSAAPAPQPKNTSGELAETGASIFVPVLIGVVLLAGGVGSLLFLRRRKRA